MNSPLLIMNVQVFSPDMAARYLTSKEAILRYDKHTIIKISASDARSINGGPVEGQRYYVRYMDGIAPELYHPEFRYMGKVDGQLVFSTVA